MTTFSAKRLIIYSHVVVFSGLAACVLLADAYRVWYDGRVYPGVRIAAQSLAGLSLNESIGFVERLNQRYQTEGVSFRVTDYKGDQHTVPFQLSQEGVPLLTLDSAGLAQQAVMVGRGGDAIDRLFGPIKLLVTGGRSLSIPLRTDRDVLQSAITTALSTYGESAQNATIKVNAFNPLSISVVPEKIGRVFDFTDITKRVLRQLSAGSFVPVEAAVYDFLPIIKEAQAAEFIAQVPQYIGGATLKLSATSSLDKKPYIFELKPTDFAPWITVVKDGVESPAHLALDETRVKEYLTTTVRPLVDQVAVDARFAIAEGKVTEFKGSQSGVEVQVASTTEALNLSFASIPSGSVPTTTVVTVLTEPQVTVAEANDLGLTEVVGVGISNFKGSHAARIKNLRRAMEILNGLLIKPGEEFSTLKALSPFTAANGYLPELVIKGDHIVPEIGGGMCQIGTTLFRLAMNTGLPITERRNHSLVVSYYADPVNHNPGTDATIYDPTVDFKFLNDTGNYLLLQAEANYKTQDITFTFWGTSDGRSGSYTHPVVSKWIPYGVAREVVVPTMKPGARDCQNAFRGAVASFTYTRTTPQGEAIDQVFTSAYRSLPAICRVGPTVESTPPACPEGQECPVPTEPAAPAEPGVPIESAI